MPEIFTILFSFNLDIYLAMVLVAKETQLYVLDNTWSLQWESHLNEAQLAVFTVRFW